MTKIKLCGLSRPCDVAAANALRPEYVGFVFAERSRRYVPPERAGELRRLLHPGIQAVGVFVDADVHTVARLLAEHTIDAAQLHGGEDEAYIRRLRGLTDRPIIRAFCVRSAENIRRAEDSAADHILLDAGAGDGKVWDWRWLRGVRRPYFLAGGLTPENVGAAVRELRPYAVDVSSGIETDGVKDTMKMAAFVRAVREEGRV